jgi:hypothetical protein
MVTLKEGDIVGVAIESSELRRCSQTWMAHRGCLQWTVNHEQINNRRRRRSDGTEQ